MNNKRQNSLISKESRGDLYNQTKSAPTKATSIIKTTNKQISPFQKKQKCNLTKRGNAHYRSQQYWGVAEGVVNETNEVKCKNVYTGASRGGCGGGC